MALTAGNEDPFRDPSLASATPQPPQPSEHVSDTLDTGRNASLTLGTDSLIVLGMRYLRV